MICNTVDYLYSLIENPSEEVKVISRGIIKNGQISLGNGVTEPVYIAFSSSKAIEKLKIALRYKDKFGFKVVLSVDTTYKISIKNYKVVFLGKF